MSYDLRRLRLHGLIERQAGTNTYTVTPEGIRVAVFYTKLHARLLRPLLDADQPPAPIELRRALATVERDRHNATLAPSDRSHSGGNAGAAAGAQASLAVDGPGRRH